MGTATKTDENPVVPLFFTENDIDALNDEISEDNLPEFEGLEFFQAELRRTKERRCEAKRIALAKLNELKKRRIKPEEPAENQQEAVNEEDSNQSEPEDEAEEDSSDEEENDKSSDSGTNEKSSDGDTDGQSSEEESQQNSQASRKSSSSRSSESAGSSSSTEIVEPDEAASSSMALDFTPFFRILKQNRETQDQEE